MTKMRDMNPNGGKWPNLDLNVLKEYRSECAIINDGVAMAEKAEGNVWFCPRYQSKLCTHPIAFA